jgi:hypothetical protein
MILGSLVSAVAQSPPAAPAPVTFTYAPDAHLVDLHALRVDITDILLTDATTGMTGSATAEVKFSTVAVPADGNGATLRLELAKIRQQMAGHSLNSAPPLPALLCLDNCARLKQISSQDPQAAGEILSQGGLPLQALAVLCGVPQLPDKPVSPGDTWQRTDTYDLPGLGQAKLEIATTFNSLQDGVAVLDSTIRANIPDFEADNPLLPGQKVKVRNMVVDLTGLVQRYEVAHSVVRQASGKLQAALEATAPDLTLPLKLVASFAYRPPAS